MGRLCFIGGVVNGLFLVCFTLAFGYWLLTLGYWLLYVMLNLFQHLTASLSYPSPRTDPETSSG